MSRIPAILKLFLLLFLAGLPPGGHAATISSARVWPAQDYTRLTLESRKAVSANMFTLANPDRLVIDVDRAKASLEGAGAKVTLK